MITADELMILVEVDRAARGLSGAGYATFLGISKGYYSRLVGGQRRPSISFCTILKTKLPELRQHIDLYITGLTERGACRSTNQALRGQNNGIDRGGDT